MQNKYIVINGTATSGKDTFVEFCQKHYPDLVINISSVDFIKEIATLCGWNGSKDNKNRKFLSDLKDLLTEWDNVPFKKVLEKSAKYKEKIIFIHSREPEDIDQYVKALEATTLLIKRSSISKNGIPNNHADQNVDNYDYDFTIYNNHSLEALEAEAERFITALRFILVADYGI